MSDTVKFRQRPDHHYTVTFPYNPTVVGLIKREVPGSGRSWDPALKEWRVSDAYVDDLAAVIQHYGFKIEVQKPANPPAPTGGTQNWAATLFSRVGPARTEAVFRAMQKVVHPDNPLTGDNDLCRELIEAREKLR